MAIYKLSDPKFALLWADLNKLVHVPMPQAPMAEVMRTAEALEAWTKNAEISAEAVAKFRKNIEAEIAKTGKTWAQLHEAFDVKDKTLQQAEQPRNAATRQQLSRPEEPVINEPQKSAPPAVALNKAANDLQATKEVWIERGVPPARTAEKVLCLFVSPERLEEAIGDAEEGYLLLVARGHGEAFARLWYRWSVFSIAARAALKLAWKVFVVWAAGS